MAHIFSDIESDDPIEWDGSISAEETEPNDLETPNSSNIQVYTNGWITIGNQNNRKIDLINITLEELDNLINDPSITKIELDSHIYSVIKEDIILHILSSNFITDFSLNLYKVNEKIINAIVNNRNLKKCNLFQCSITNELCKILITSPSITNLGLQYDHLDLETVKILCTSSIITKLNLWWCNLKLECCEILAKNINLTYLNIAENQITDQGVIYLLNNPSLTHLDISSVGMENEELVLEHIKNNHRLVYLGMNCAFDDYYVEITVENHIQINKHNSYQKNIMLMELV